MSALIGLDAATLRALADAVERRGRKVLDPKATAEELAEFVERGTGPTIGWWLERLEPLPMLETGPERWLREDPERRLMDIFTTVGRLGTPDPDAAQRLLARGLADYAVSIGIDRKLAELVVDVCVGVIDESAVLRCAS
ncbi:MAG: hypothetical protein ABSA65_14900 [Acidimicrobiales bacterium]|jgi:hypothetical protein